MKPNPRNIDQVVKRYMPSASSEDMKSDIDHVFQQLQSREKSTDHAVEESVLSPTPMTSFRWRVRMVFAAAVVLLGVFMGTVVWRTGPAFAVVERVDGSLYRLVEGKPEALQLGASLDAGQTVRSNGGSSGTLKLADGSQVEVRSESEFSVVRVDDGIQIQLIRGTIIVNAAKQFAGHLYVKTKDVVVSVVGTVFLVNAEEEGSRVAVIEGKVRVQQGTTTKNLNPGEQLMTNPRMEPFPMEEEVARSRNAEGQLALLQQQSAVAQATTAPSRREAFEEASIRPARSSQVEGARGNNTTLLGCSAGPAQVDPRRFAIQDLNVHTLIALAYATPGNDCTVVSMTGRLTGGPGWIRSDQFDIEAVMPEGTPAYTSQQFRYGEAPKLQMMLQTLLADRFKASVRREMKELPVFALMLGRAADAAQFTKLAADSYRPNTNEPPPGSPEFRNGVFGGGLRGERLISGRNVSLEDLIPQLETYTGRPVVNRTGITGKFYFDLHFENVPDDVPTRGIQGLGRPLNSGSLAALLKSIQEQLGLKLESAKAPVEVLVIDRVERPAEN